MAQQGGSASGQLFSSDAGLNYDSDQWQHVLLADDGTGQGGTRVYVNGQLVGTVDSLIRDGLSNTYMVGERYLNPDHYFTGNAPNDDQCAYSGSDQDVLAATTLAPAQDRVGWPDVRLFGSARSGTFNMAFYDGSVCAVSYSIDPDVHRLTGDRASGEVIDQSGF